MGQGDTPLTCRNARRAYAQLVSEDLPRAGRARGWPWVCPSDFDRLLRGGAEAPPETLDLVLAVELGQRLLAGTACPHRLAACRRREG